MITFFTTDYGTWTDGRRLDDHQWAWNTNAEIYTRENPDESDERPEVYSNWIAGAEVAIMEDEEGLNMTQNDCMQVLTLGTFLVLYHII